MELSRLATVMANESSQVNNSPRFRLETGLDVLDVWAETASQTKKNAVYKALFAMQDGSLFRSYRIVDDFQKLNEVYVIVKDNLVMKLRINSVDSYDILAIGPCGNTADLHTGKWGVQ
ncbi:DUF6235 family protein [Actinophytocola sp.]|uniref:DUF6235 family protein n=1 Tax=Actinophytocola sp. TaxID=1872138 RepID=UPI002ED25CBE